MATERQYDPDILEQCGWLLQELEVQMTWSATIESWTQTARTKWRADIEASVSCRSLTNLYGLARHLENSMNSDLQAKEWIEWKRDYWIALYMGDSRNGVYTSVTVTQFAQCTMTLEMSLHHSAYQLGWKESRRSIWLRKANALVVPAEDVLFALDILEQIDKCNGKTTVSQWGRNVDYACAKLIECAITLEIIQKGTGVLKATTGTAAITGGALAIGGLIAAPFTLGTSVALTLAGTALAVGGGVTSFGASLMKNGWDKIKTEEGRRVTEEVCKQAQTLAQCLSFYCETLTKFKAYLDTYDGRLLITELKSYLDTSEGRQVMAGQISVTELRFKSRRTAVRLGLAGMKVAQVVRLMKVVSLLRPVAAGELGRMLATSAVAEGLQGISVEGITLFAGVAALPVIGGPVSIGFGIWDILQGADHVMNRNEIAGKFQQLARDLRETKKTIYDLYWSLVDAA